MKQTSFFIKKCQKNCLFSFLVFSFALSVGIFSLLEIKKTENEIFDLSRAQISTSFFPERKIKPITLVFVGDIMLDRGVELKVRQYGKGDWRFPFLKIVDVLNGNTIKTDTSLELPSLDSDLTRGVINKEERKTDVLFGNLEGPISDKGTRVGSIYSFRLDPKAIEGLNYAGFDILSVANNHLFDYGKASLEDTFLRLKEAGISYVGGGFNSKEAYSPVIKEVRGTRIAFLAFTNLGSKYWAAQENCSGIAWLEKEVLKEEISKAKTQAEVVIVSFHLGDEYQAKSNFLQKSFARLAVDSGADLVIGHHPHVIQEIEKYRNKYIIYSLGNFIFDQDFSRATMEGLIIKVVIEDKEIGEVIPIKIKINKYFQPEIAGENEE